MPKENLTIQLPGGPTIELVYVQGGTFMMGSDDTKAHDREKPAHQVKLTDFYIGKYPITQEQWQAVTGNNPCGFQGKDRPVPRVLPWALEYCPVGAWRFCQIFLSTEIANNAEKQRDNHPYPTLISAR